MRITIKELSEMSGYSVATISRVISNKGNVKQETREAIEKLLVEQNYRTNVMELRQTEQNRKTIMVVIGELNNFYYSELIHNIKEETALYGYTLLLAYTDNQIEDEENFVRTAMKGQYAGLLFINVRGGESLAKLLKEGDIPVVFLNRGIRFSDFDAVTSDNYQGGFMITSYLIEMGHKRIGHLMGHTYSMTAQERRRGYEDAMKRAGLSITSNSVYIGKMNYDSGYAYGEYLVKKGLDYTAVFCGNDLMAIGLSKALEEYGLKVPEDISLACYDETLYAKNAGLTTVGAASEKLAKRAVETLLKKINGEQTESGTVVFRPQIVKRSSVIKR